jgi:hypothetical protein
MHAELATDEKLVDLTYVTEEPSSDFLALTYRGVDPSTWKSANANIGLDFSTNLNPTRTGVTYTNVPANSYDPNANLPYLFSNYAYGEVDFEPPSGNTISFRYDKYPGNFAYLLLPKNGLYKIFTPGAGNDTVDLTTMDTANRVRFNLPSNLKFSWCNLVGVTDTTDFTSSYRFYYATLQSDVADAMYPKLPVQKYFTLVNANDQNHTHFYLASTYADSIPVTPAFFQPSDWHIVSEEPDNFTINFPGEKPTYYDVHYNTLKIYWTVISSRDANVQHPLTMLGKIKGIKMKDETISDLSFNSWSMYNFNDYNYQEYMQLATDPGKHTFSHIYKFKQVNAGQGVDRIGKNGEFRVMRSPNDKW